MAERTFYHGDNGNQEYTFIIQEGVVDDELHPGEGHCVCQGGSGAECLYGESVPRQVARQEINADVSWTEEQCGFDARA